MIYDWQVSSGNLPVFLSAVWCETAFVKKLLKQNKSNRKIAQNL